MHDPLMLQAIHGLNFLYRELATWLYVYIYICMYVFFSPLKKYKTKMVLLKIKAISHFSDTRRSSNHINITHQGTENFARTEDTKPYRSLLVPVSTQPSKQLNRPKSHQNKLENIMNQSCFSQIQDFCWLTKIWEKTRMSQPKQSFGTGKGLQKVSSLPNYS